MRMVARSVVGALLALLGPTGCEQRAGSIVVGSKNFTESVLLGEIVAQQLERAGLRVDRRLNLGGSFICHEALRAGQLDVYVEYTGTAYAAILKMSGERDASRVRAIVDSIYGVRWDLAWMAGLGFDNTFAMLVRGEDARRLGLTTLSDAVPHAGTWQFGAGYEFIERADGYRGLLDAYGIAFAGSSRQMDLGLTYRALADGKVDIIAGNSTDGQIEALGLFHLADDRAYFPPYEAAPVVRRGTLRRYPVVRELLNRLGGSLTDTRMRHLNYLVEVIQRDVADVAKEFLASLDAPPEN